MKPRNAIMLLTAALIWGIAFVAQSVGMDYMGPFTFNGLRSLIGGVVLLPCIAIFGGREKSNTNDTDQASGTTRDLVTGGLLCGVILFLATSLQQIGIQYTSVGKCGFITAFYIVMVPVFGIFLGKKTGWRVWLAVLIALAGLYFLCITEKFTIGRGDTLVFLCAILFALHILMFAFAHIKFLRQDPTASGTLAIGLLKPVMQLMRELHSLHTLRIRWAILLSPPKKHS